MEIEWHLTTPFTWTGNSMMIFYLGVGAISRQAISRLLTIKVGEFRGTVSTYPLKKIIV